MVKQICVVNGGALGGSVAFKLNGSASTARIIVAAMNAGESTELSGLFVVLQPAETLQAIASQAGFIVAGFGAELEGVAD